MLNNILDYVSTKTISIIGEFSIWWGQFELIVFQNNLKTYDLIKWSNSIELDNTNINELCNDIRNRAVDFLTNINDCTIRDKLYSEKNNGNSTQRKLILDFLSNKSDNQFAGCMLFIERIRNNLFHGLKDIYSFNNQSEIFISINSLFKYLVNGLLNGEIDRLFEQDK